MRSGYNSLMKITIRRSGGFGGTLLNKTFEVRTESLPRRAADEVQRTLDTLPVAAPLAKAGRTKGGADMFRYEVTIEGPDGPVVLSFDDGSVPEAFKPAWSILRPRMKG